MSFCVHFTEELELIVHSHTHTFHPSQNELRERTQVVTEEEREHVMSGNFDQLLAEQERMDRERDNEVQ